MLAVGFVSQTGSIVLALAAQISRLIRQESLFVVAQTKLRTIRPWAEVRTAVLSMHGLDTFMTSSYWTPLGAQKKNVWTQIALEANDQLRQRVAWALAQILVVSPIDIAWRQYMYRAVPCLLRYLRSQRIRELPRCSQGSCLQPCHG
jgi:hypothetical protein